MYRYKYDKNYHHKSRRSRRTTALAVFVTTIVIGIAGYIAYDVISQLFDRQAPVSRANYSSVQGDSVNLFSSPYFQFQADDTWKEMSGEETPTHFVYRSYKSTLVTRDITIDINKGQPEATPLVRTTRVYPVTVDGSGKLISQGGTSDHCNTLMPKNALQVPTPVVQHQVSFVCNPDAIIYQVVVGLIGGNTNISIPRPNGSNANYMITYRDLTINSSDAALRTIIQSFQTR